MFCPRCSQQQVSEETKFCSRCGFPLGLVSEILAHGGFLPQLAELYQSKNRLTRRNGLIFSLFWFLIVTAIFTPLLGIIGAPDALVGFTGLIGSVGALILVIASFLLLKKPLSPLTMPPPERRNAALSANQTPALPPDQTTADSYIPPANSWQSNDTDEFVRRSSVVENTTKLLNRDE